MNHKEKVEIHYKTTKENKAFVEKLANEIGIRASVCLAVIIYLDKILE